MGISMCRRFVLGLLIAAPLLVATDGSAAETVETPTEYLDVALRLMQQHSLYRNEATWPEVESRAQASCEDAVGFADTYPAIRQALRDIGDQHGFLSMPKPPPHDAATDSADAAKEEPEEQSRPKRPQPEVRLLPDRVGYVKLFAYASSDFTVDQRYVADLHDRITQVAENDPIGWVIDLRDNNGGNMWPMLYGVGPILGEGVAGYFVYAGGKRTPWSYRTQPLMALIDPHVGLLPAEPCRLGEELPWAAVLTGEGTASSGEAIAVSFRARQRSRSFGAPTYGFSTSTRPCRLPDGVQLVLTTARFADRDGHDYGGKITPDEVTDGNDDAALAAAKAWLMESATALTE